MKNKRGKMKTGGVILVILFVAVLIAGLGVGGYFLLSQSIAGQGNNAVGTCAGSPPVVSFHITDALKPGTAVTPGNNYTIYDGTYSGTNVPTSLSSGKSINVLMNASAYLNSQASISSLKCGTNDMTFKPYAYKVQTLIGLDNHLRTLATATQNESQSANQITDTIKLSGTPKTSTGEMLVVVDFGNKTQVLPSDMSLKGGSLVTTPTWISPASTASSVAAFTVPAIVDGGSQSYDLTFSPESGQTIGAGGTGTLVTITVYSLQPTILDTNNGVFQSSNTWQDSLGAQKTIGSASISYYIA